MLRNAGISVAMDYAGKAKKRFERADKYGATFAVMVGDEELANGTATVKNLKTGAQETILRNDLITKLKAGDEYHVI